MTPQDRALLEDVTQFIYREARLQDDHAYDEWEALWTDDAIYWIPANGEGEDPENKMSIVYDNRSRISLRVRQLKTGRRFSQSPKSRLRRLISNVEILSTDDQHVTVTANALLFESHVRGDTLWASRNEYKLRRDGDGFRLVSKKVILVNNETALFSMAFLI
ncbi:MAG: aromatic-ring-hydroxylating dioxygenase subunit beta [Burkholderiales bacterium]